jgi:predicted amidohydrolase
MAQDRRDFLKTTALAGAGSLLAGGLAPGRADGAIKGKSAPLSMRDDGTYETVELVRDSVRLGVVQSRVRGVRVEHWQKDKQANLAHMLELIDNAFHFSAGADILFFHEFPITGYNTWTREEILRFAIEIPGEETEAVARKAKEYGCYIVFGSYATDPDWPNHVLSITTIVGPDGSIVDKHWKARNIKGVFPGVELFTTTIYDVFDEYVEMYGPDAVIPVTRTPYGNIATSSVQREPELFRAFAMKGAEIILRTASGGFTPMDMQATSLYNGVYTAICNNAYSPDNPGFFDDAGSGGSAIYGPRGDVLAEADTQFETMVAANIPIAAYRARHRQPIVHMELYEPVFEAYRNPYGPNLFSQYLPSDLKDSKRYLADKSRWK